MTLREKMSADIEAEFNRFFEWTSKDKSCVSSVSCKLFAEHMMLRMRDILMKDDDVRMP